MGSPISPVIADLVMEQIEETAIATAPHPPKGWFRYVDDSHTCLRKQQVDEFHQHLNSINLHIQFTLELEDTRDRDYLFWTPSPQGGLRKMAVETPYRSTVQWFRGVPYVRGISERISWILRQHQIKVAFKPLRTVKSLFPRPKAREKVDRSQSGTVYKISYTNCSFVYYGQTERSLKTRITEHKRAVAMFDHDSKVACHVHEMDIGSVRVVGHEANYHERLFLEAWYPIKDPQSGNDHIAILDVYKSLACA
ncbi:uncharacterized protein [Montipora foliosa]|uniref:uncharacterized protein n=1 Tax=Montipora foliosa TaxID=591990 RepID=UPI0035F20193